MELEAIHNITVLGAGVMGHGIAQSFIMGGYTVTLNDIQESVLLTAEKHIRENLKAFRNAGLIRKEDVDNTLQRLESTVELRHAVEKSDFIVETVSEDLSLKQALFEQIELFCPEDTILATNTSSLTLKDIGLRVKNKERLVVTHWFNPPHIVPTVEVVKGERTSDQIFETTYALLSKIGKVPVRINQDLPGFLVNRIQTAMAREVLDLYERGVASAEDIDRAVKGSIGFRLASIGPLATMDLGGIKLWLKAFKNTVPHIQSSTDPPKALQRLVSQGHDGIKSGKGFYDYATDFSKGGPDEAIQRRDREFLDRLKGLYWTADEDE